MFGGTLDYPKIIIIFFSGIGLSILRGSNIIKQEI